MTISPASATFLSNTSAAPMATSQDDAAFRVRNSSLFTPPLSRPIPSRKEIYQKIDSIICQVKTPRGTATGFCIGKNLLVVPFHVLQLEEVERINATTVKYNARPIQCIYQGITYEAEWHTASMQTACNCDCAIYKIKDDDFPSLPDLQLFTGEIEPGEEVYFGGFPLTQQEPTFHGGFISSVAQKGEISLLTIDGTVVPGNSGSPVFTLKHHELQLIGIISYQVADFDPESKKIITILQSIKGNGAGLNHSVNITTEKGVETIRINDTDAIIMALDLIQRNLSTGIGKALHSRHLIDVCDGRALSSPHPSNGMPVMKGERLPGMLPRDMAYLDWYHHQVKGQSLCAQIIGRQLDAADDITPAEEKKLWDYSQTQPRYKGFAGFTPEEEFKRLKDKVLSAKPKALKIFRDTWKARLLHFQTALPDLKSQIEELFLKIGAEASDSQNISISGKRGRED